MSAQHDHGNGHHHDGHHQAASEMREACSAFLDSLSAEQKERTTFNYLDGERIFWYYPPANRHGLAIRDMDEEQRKLAYAVMATGLTDKSYQQAVATIENESLLGSIEKGAGVITYDRDPELYYWTVFGEPGGDGPWGWRVEGHHVSFNYGVWDDEVISTTPFFLGANPHEIRTGPDTGHRILGVREDLAFELMNDLDSSQRSRAVIYGEAPYDILTYNSSKAVLPPGEGLRASRMSGTQREMLMSLIAEYVNQVRQDVASDKLAAIEEGGIDDFQPSVGRSGRKGKRSTTIVSTAGNSWWSTSTGRTGRTIRTPCCGTWTTTSVWTCCASTCWSTTCSRGLGVARHRAIRSNLIRPPERN